MVELYGALELLTYSIKPTIAANLIIRGCGPGKFSFFPIPTLQIASVAYQGLGLPLASHHDFLS